MVDSKADAPEPAAGEIVHNADSRDHFEVLGLPRRLQVDQAQLAKNYYALSRLYHPDFHHSASPSERVASLRRTAAVNDAYKTLKDPVARGKWWLEANGGRLNQSNQVPPDLVELVFEVQDAISEIGDSSDPAQITQIARYRDEVKSELAMRLSALNENFAQWDSRSEDADTSALRDDLQRILASISYLRTLLRDIETARENVRS